jgi:hypothetical protein
VTDGNLIGVDLNDGGSTSDTELGCATKVDLSPLEVAALAVPGRYNEAFVVNEAFPGCEDAIYYRDTRDLPPGGIWVPPTDDYERTWYPVEQAQANLQWEEVPPSPRKLVVSWDGDEIWQIEFRRTEAAPPYQRFIFSDSDHPRVDPGACGEDQTGPECTK